METRRNKKEVGFYRNLSKGVKVKEIFNKECSSIKENHNLSQDFLNEINYRILKNLKIKKNKYVKIKIDISRRIFNILKNKYKVNGRFNRIAMFDNLITTKRNYNGEGDWCMYRDFKVKINQYKDFQYKNEKLELLNVKKGYCLLSISFIRVDVID